MTKPKLKPCKFLGLMCQRCSDRMALKCSCYEPRRKKRAADKRGEGK